MLAVDDFTIMIDDSLGSNGNSTQNSCDNTKKRTWTLSEDRLLLQLVRIHGAFNWSKISQMMTGRSGKQCHNRWNNCLNPEIKRGNWKKEEDDIIMDSFSEIGKQWSKISLKLIGRNPLAVKNRYFSLLASKRKQKFDELIFSDNFLDDHPQPINDMVKTSITASDKCCDSKISNINNYNPYFHNNSNYNGNIIPSQSSLTATLDSARTDHSDITTTNETSLSINEIFTKNILPEIRKGYSPDVLSNGHISSMSNCNKKLKTSQNLQTHHHSGYLFPDVLHLYNHQFNNTQQHHHHNQLQQKQQQQQQQHSMDSQSVGFQPITPCTTTTNNTATTSGNSAESPISSCRNYPATATLYPKDKDDLCDDVNNSNSRNDVDNASINDELSNLTDDKRDESVVFNNHNNNTYYHVNLHYQHQQPIISVYIPKKSSIINNISNTCSSTNTNTATTLQYDQNENHNNNINYEQVVVLLPTSTSTLVPPSNTDCNHTSTTNNNNTMAIPSSTPAFSNNDLITATTNPASLTAAASRTTSTLPVTPTATANNNNNNNNNNNSNNDNTMTNLTCTGSCTEHVPVVLMPVPGHPYLFYDVNHPTILKIQQSL